jgi:hypothetical protein
MVPWERIEAVLDQHQQQQQQHDAAAADGAGGGGGGGGVSGLAAALMTLGWSPDPSADRLQLNNHLTLGRVLAGSTGCSDTEREMGCRALRVIDAVLLPLLALAGEKRLVDDCGDTQPLLKQFCRGLLRTGILALDADAPGGGPDGWRWRDGTSGSIRERTMAVVRGGMAKLEAELEGFYHDRRVQVALAVVLPGMDREGGAEQLVGEAIQWGGSGGGTGSDSDSILHQQRAHGAGAIRWLYECNDRGAVGALLAAGLTARRVAALVSASLPSVFGGADPTTVREFWARHVYAWWLLAVAAECDKVVQPWAAELVAGVNATIATAAAGGKNGKLESESESGSGSEGGARAWAHHRPVGVVHKPAPLKAMPRILEKTCEYWVLAIALWERSVR